ncbi:hypothetical protein [Dactylosporangium sp. CA-092794]|uniref:hypothetical protein n=1 Tax=Dactylosporangium sp. CA-092794 TaxID=3239929 RepID=UPI003D909D7F
MVVGLIIAAVLFGQHGVEVASWLAGVGSFVLAFATLFLALPSRTSDGARRTFRFSGKARGNALVVQAGRDVHNVGNNQRSQP